MSSFPTGAIASSASSASPSRMQRLSPPPGQLVGELHSKFGSFQAQAKNIEERMRSIQSPVDSGHAQELLERYSASLVSDIRAARDVLRQGRWDIHKDVHEDYNVLCFCLAVWELTHEVAVSAAPTASRVLHWYSRHYLEDDIAEWWNAAQQWASDPKANDADSPLWEPLVRLALADCSAEVAQVLDQMQRFKASAEVKHVYDFLRRIPSLRHMDEAGASEVEQRQAAHEVQAAAQELLREQIIAKHPIKQLVEVYAGCPQDCFEKGTDLAKKWARTWIEDFVYSHAWVFPDLRRSELGDLMRAVAARHADEDIDDIDRVLFSVLTLDVPELLDQVASLEDNFPKFFVAHFVDVLYFAGRVPSTVQAGAPPRELYIMQYAEELAGCARSNRRIGIDYLRAGASKQCRAAMESALDQYCESAETVDEVEEALVLVADLGLNDKFGTKLCLRWSQKARSRGDFETCLRWACRAEGQAAESSGARVSELVDELAAENREALMDAVAKLEASSSDASATASTALRPPSVSGRLYFAQQYALCRARKNAKESYAPQLVRLLSQGVAAPGFARAVIEEDLLPILRNSEVSVLSADDVLLLMRYVQVVRQDPLRRVELGVCSGDAEELHKLLGSCLSRALMEGPGQLTYGMNAAQMPHCMTSWTALSPGMPSLSSC